MGHRLSKIYTRTGDDGTTGLATGERVPKTHARIEAFGSVDETNSLIGLVLAEDEAPAPLAASLARIQHELFELGAALSLPGYAGPGDDAVAALEADLDALNADLPPLREFVLPGGSRAAAACHLARTVCRRAERDLWRLAADEAVDAALTGYLNRLSDFLFVAARTIARAGGGREVLWNHERGAER